MRLSGATGGVCVCVIIHMSYASIFVQGNLQERWKRFQAAAVCDSAWLIHHMLYLCAQEFAEKYGDGSKRLLLMTAAGTRQAMQQANASAGPSYWPSVVQPSLTALCLSLAQLQVIQLLFSFFFHQVFLSILASLPCAIALRSHRRARYRCLRIYIILFYFLCPFLPHCCCAVASRTN